MRWQSRCGAKQVFESREDTVLEDELIAEDDVTGKALYDVKVADKGRTWRCIRFILVGDGGEMVCEATIPIVIYLSRCGRGSVELQLGVEDHAVGENGGPVDEVDLPPVPPFASDL